MTDCPKTGEMDEYRESWLARADSQVEMTRELVLGKKT